MKEELSTEEDCDCFFHLLLLLLLPSPLSRYRDEVKSVVEKFDQTVAELR